MLVYYREGEVSGSASVQQVSGCCVLPSKTPAQRPYVGQQLPTGGANAGLSLVSYVQSCDTGCSSSKLRTPQAAA